MTKFMLASDWDPAKQRFPVGMQPKIDGVRGGHFDYGLTGRSLKKHKNIFNTQFFSQGGFKGFDGELAAAADTDQALCRLTSSAMSTIEGQPFVLMWAFDYVTPETIKLPYQDRYHIMRMRITDLAVHHSLLAQRIRPVQMVTVHSMEQLEEQDDMWSEAGYEGSILRDLRGLYKEGRSTVKEGGLLRIKRFETDEFLITGFTEGETNGNEAKLNEMGNTERSTHMENMTPNGMIGNFLGTDVKTGKPVKVSAGKLPHDLRKLWFEQPQLFMNKIGMYKHFPKGVKDKARFATFQTLRDESDIGSAD